MLKPHCGAGSSLCHCEPSDCLLSFPFCWVLCFPSHSVGYRVVCTDLSSPAVPSRGQGFSLTASIFHVALFITQIILFSFLRHFTVPAKTGCAENRQTVTNPPPPHPRKTCTIKRETSSYLLKDPIFFESAETILSQIISQVL